MRIMKTRGIRFSKKNGKPTHVKVELTIREAGYLAILTGQHSDYSANACWSNHAGENYDIYSELTDKFFNRFWEDGVNGWDRGDEC